MQTIRKIKIEDALQVLELINYFANKGKMLGRSRNYIYENIRDFWVVEIDGKIVGCCALHICWEDLAEVKSLAVHDDYQHRGIGHLLIQKCLQEAREIGVKKVFALTYQKEFFAKEGFKIISKDNLPHKIWTDCINCPKFPNCDEIAMLYEL